MDSKMLKVARKYLKAGFSVIPLNGKIPAIEWKEYQTRYPTDKELEQWFADDTKNIGIVTGKISDITVVDVDAKSGGLETIKTLGLPVTWTVKTGGGGWHYYYKYCPEAHQTAGIYQGIDIRNDGGQVVAPPSLHQSGNYYEWTYKEDELVNFPISLFKKETIFKSTDWKETLTKGATQGTRNETAAKVFGKLLTLFKKEEWEQAWKIGLSWNAQNSPPLNETELRSVFTSIATREALKIAPIDKSVPIKTDYPLRYTWGTRELDTSLAIIKRGHFVVVAAKASAGKTTFVFDMAVKNARLGHKTLFLSLEMDEQDILDDFGRKFAGITIEEEYDYKIPKDKQALYDKKVKELKETPNLTIKSIRRSGDTQWEDIVQGVKEHGETDLIFIDNLDLIGAKDKENDLDRQKRIVKEILKFTSQTKIPVVLIHHYRKTGTNSKDQGFDEMSGSGKIRDGADRIIKVMRNTNKEAEYPEKYKSTIHLQKGRGYPECSKEVYFIRGTFVDIPPSEDYYYNYQKAEEVATDFGGEIMPEF